MMSRHFVASVVFLTAATSVSAQQPASPFPSRLLSVAAFERILHSTPSPQTADKDANRRWEALAAGVRPGDIIVVTRKNLTSAEGELTGIDQRSIEIRVRGTPLSIAAGDVLTVRRAGVRRRHVWRGILIGMAAGAIAVAAIDQASDHPEPGDAAIIGAVVLGLPGGAAVGALLPLGPPLYEAPAEAATARSGRRDGRGL